MSLIEDLLIYIKLDTRRVELQHAFMKTCHITNTIQRLFLPQCQSNIIIAIQHHAIFCSIVCVCACVCECVCVCVCVCGCVVFLCVPMCQTLQLTGKNVGLVVEVDASVSSLLFVDGRHLQQVLTHLCDNAVKFTQSGTITFAITRVQREQRSLHSTPQQQQPRHLDSDVKQSVLSPSSTLAPRRQISASPSVKLSRGISERCATEAVAHDARACVMEGGEGTCMGTETVRFSVTDTGNVDDAAMLLHCVRCLRLCAW